MATFVAYMLSIGASVIATTLGINFHNGGKTVSATQILHNSTVPNGIVIARYFKM